jgi:GTP cyclohydrolase II
VSEPRAAARAIDALRRGWPLSIEGQALLAVETATEESLAEFDPGSTADLLIGSGRAATLKLANQIEAADPATPVQVARTPWLDLAGATALADPALDLATPLKGPYRSVPLVAPQPSAAALHLAREAGLLPAFFIRAGGADVMASVDEVLAYGSAAELRLAARARLPVELAENSEIVAFRAREGGDVHVALVIGRPDGSPPLVRLHSECLTGDVFGSLKCDCGPQLQVALRDISASGWGILLYLRQEGRGIGLVNKLRAYGLQDAGFDTVDANTRLGLAVDARDFRIAARMLQLLGQDRIRLLTNNPAKVAVLEAAGIRVVERVPHALPTNPHNERYLATKRDRTGHQL